MTTETIQDGREADVLVVGSGIAGCAAALSAARAGADVLVATKASKPADASSDRAQGGIATNRGSPETFTRDIIEASAGTADEHAVEVLVENAAEAVDDVLIDTLDVEFDESGDCTECTYDYAREAAHSDHRILHVRASTGQYILRPFLSYLDDHDLVEICQETMALELITHEGRVHGAFVQDGDAAGQPTAEDARPSAKRVFAGTTILATGGIGSLFGRSTNPPGSTGDGVSMAALAGADLEDMEFIQFHPTAFAGEDPFLLSEAVRGEGGLLRDGTGDRFMPAIHEAAELAPRDIVARAVDAAREETGSVTLDVSEVAFQDRFPDLGAKCEARGVDPADGIPVAPAQHFLCGGIDVDDQGRTSLDRLFAVGECARTGVHGANRLASTSLLEGLVWGLRAGEAASGSNSTPVEASEPLTRDPALPDGFAQDKFHRLRRVMDEAVGLRRNSEGLNRAESVLTRLKGEVDAYTRTRTARDLYELRNASITALLIARAANENETSVGCHYLEG